MICHYADMHCDTLLRGYSDGAESLYDGTGHINFKKMAEAQQVLQFFAVFFPPEKAFEMRFGRKNPDGSREVPDDESFYRDAVKVLHEAVDRHNDVIALARNRTEVETNRKSGKSSAVLTIEDGRFLNDKISRLTGLYEDGVRAIALTWNHENCLGYPNSTDPEMMNRGLKPFGIEALEEMNRLDILADVSHLNAGGFWDVAKHSHKPFIASHSNCYAITQHPRNLTDEQIRALADHGGIMGLNFFQSFVVPGDTVGKKNLPETTVDMLAAHIEHMYQIGGEDLPALGTDFDGFDGKPEIDGPDKMELLFNRLAKDGFSERTLDKFRYENVLRVLG